MKICGVRTVKVWHCRMIEKDLDMFWKYILGCFFFSVWSARSMPEKTVLEFKRESHRNSSFILCFFITPENHSGLHALCNKT